MLGRFGWVQVMAFVTSGLSTLALAYTLRQLTWGTWGSRIGAGSPEFAGQGRSW